MARFSAVIEEHLIRVTSIQPLVAVLGSFGIDQCVPCEVIATGNKAGLRGVFHINLHVWMDWYGPDVFYRQSLDQAGHIDF